MHHVDHWPAVRCVFVAANLAIAGGYASIPFLFLPYIPLPRSALALGAGFFGLCGLVHAGMAFGDGHLMGYSWFWALEHAVQAICTWGFILIFARSVRQAQATLRRRAAGADDNPGRSL